MFNDIDNVNPRLATEFIMGMEWGLNPKAGKEELLALSGSFDEGVKNKARQMLEEMWYLQPEQDANAETVERADLLAIFEQLDEQTKEFILQNIVAIEFTQGCNGGCGYCFLGEKKRGISQKFSFSSVIAFFTAYGEKIQENAPYKVFPYFNTDLLDYRDGEKTALDIYKLLFDTCPTTIHTLNTSLPTGSQDVFVDLVLHIADVWKEIHFCPTQINLTISRHNAQRAEVCLALIEKKLQDRGLSAREVDYLMKEMVSIKCKDMKTGKGLQFVAKLLERNDEMEDVGSPACLDGVVLSPKGVRSVAMVAATPIHRTGNFEQQQQGGTLFAFDSIWNYLKMRTDSSEAQSDIELMRTNGVVFMEPIMTNEGTPYGDDTEWTDEERLKKFDEVLVHISRHALGIQYFLRTLVHFCDAGVPTMQLEQFVALAKERWQEKTTELAQIFSRLEQLPVPNEQSTQLEYFKHLHELLAAKTNLLLGTYDRGDRRYVRKIGIVLDAIGLKLASQLPEILNDLETLGTSEEKIVAFVEKYWGHKDETFTAKMIRDLR